MHPIDQFESLKHIFVAHLIGIVFILNLIWWIDAQFRFGSYDILIFHECIVTINILINCSQKTVWWVSIQVEPSVCSPYLLVQSMLNQVFFVSCFFWQGFQCAGIRRNSSQETKQSVLVLSYQNITAQLFLMGLPFNEVLGRRRLNVLNSSIRIKADLFSRYILWMTGYGYVNCKSWL